ncbi:hypothetical protein MMC17_008111 [Xylographa soralifera]|nr:hypothetical protein [Xylographa soralifera]
MTSDKVKVVGGTKNFWIWSEDDGFDLTHPPKPTSSPVYPRIPLATSKGRITIDPTKTALVVVDMQNYFLFPLLGRPSSSVGLRVVDELLKHAIPAKQDIDEMPPSVVRGFEFGLDNSFDGGKAKNLGALGEDMGQLKLDNGAVIEAGRVMIRDEWNTAFYPRLAETAKPQDLWVYKNRLSGFWRDTGIEEAFVSRGVRTLLFAGENTDQCVRGSM